MGIWKETAAVSAAALIGLFLLPWALTREPAKAAELPQAQGGPSRFPPGTAVPSYSHRPSMTKNGHCGYWTAAPSGK